MSNDPAIVAGETVAPPPTELPQDVPAPEEKEPVTQETEAEKPEEAVEEDKKPFRSGYAREKYRRQRLIAQQEQLAAENETLRKELEAFKNSGVSPDIKRPKMQDFTDMDAYEDAMDKYRLEQTRKVLAEQRAQDEQKQAQSKQQESQGEVLDDFFERWNELEKQMPDAKESVDQLYAQIGPLKPGVRDLIAEADNGEIVLYFISKNPGIGRQLNNADPITAAKIIGQLEERTKLPLPRTQTAAPPPIKTPTGGASAPRDVFNIAKKDDASDYIKMRMAMEKK